MARALLPAREARARSPELSPHPPQRWIVRSARDDYLTTRSQSAFHLVRFNPREQWHRFANNVLIRQTAPLRILETKPFFFSAQLHLPIQLIENSVCGSWQHRRNKDGKNSKRLCAVVQQIFQKFAILWFR